MGRRLDNARIHRHFQVVVCGGPDGGAPTPVMSGPSILCARRNYFKRRPARTVLPRSAADPRPSSHARTATGLYRTARPIRTHGGPAPYCRARGELNFSTKEREIPKASASSEAFRSRSMSTPDERADRRCPTGYPSLSRSVQALTRSGHYRRFTSFTASDDIHGFGRHSRLRTTFTASDDIHACLRHPRAALVPRGLPRISAGRANGRWNVQRQPEPDTNIVNMLGTFWDTMLCNLMRTSVSECRKMIC
jgi:hypothetical protein